MAVLPFNILNRVLTDTYVVELRVDYLIHVLIYFPFGLLALNSISYRYWIIVLIGMLVSISNAALQLVLPYRVFNNNDLIANCIGFLIGMVVLIPQIKHKVSAFLD